MRSGPGRVDQTWLLPSFHCKIVNWWALAVQEAVRLTHLAEIVHRKPTHLGLRDTSGIWIGYVWIDLANSGRNLVWRHPWPPYIISNLVSSTDPEGKITNSDLELATFVLHETTILAAVPTACMDAPRSRSENTPTISQSTWEAS